METEVWILDEEGKRAGRSPFLSSVIIKKTLLCRPKAASDLKSIAPVRAESDLWSLRLARGVLVGHGLPCPCSIYGVSGPSFGVR